MSVRDLGREASPGGVSPGGPDVLLGWLALHVFLYGGTTAFNAYYDRDEGPVGGMLHPPRVDPGLLPFSLAFQALGLPLALWIGPGFAAAWLALALLFAAYSHPAVRLKAHPAAALTAIAVGQGACGFAAGWLVVAPAPSLASASAGWGMAAGAWASLSLVVLFAVLGGGMLAWAARFDEGLIDANYRRAMAFTKLAGLGLSAVLALLLAGIGVPNAA